MESKGYQNMENINFYDKIMLKILNEKVFSKGLIDEKTKESVDKKIILSK